MRGRLWSTSPVRTPREGPGFLTHMSEITELAPIAMPGIETLWKNDDFVVNWCDPKHPCVE